MAKKKFTTTTTELPTSAVEKDSDWMLTRRLRKSDRARLTLAVEKVEEHNETMGKKVNSTNVLKALIYLSSSDATIAKKVMKVIKEEF